MRPHFNPEAKSSIGQSKNTSGIRKFDPQTKTSSAADNFSRKTKCPDGPYKVRGDNQKLHPAKSGSRQNNRPVGRGSTSSAEFELSVQTSELAVQKSSIRTPLPKLSHWKRISVLSAPGWLRNCTYMARPTTRGALALPELSPGNSAWRFTVNVRFSIFEGDSYEFTRTRTEHGRNNGQQSCPSNAGRFDAEETNGD